MLQGLYFRSIDFLNVGKEAQASCCQLSILLRQDILKQNGIKTIEYGESVHLFHDPWTLKLSRQNSQVNNANWHRQLKVTSLIRTNDPTWNMEEIQSWTQTIEWELIQRIPIHTEQNRDDFIRPYSKSDQQTTISVYQ